MKVTESQSLYNNLETMSFNEILYSINKEDQKIAQAVHDVIPHITKLSEKIYQQIKSGGRLFYIGSGTSGRLGVLDASECPPTFGVSNDLVIALIAGGDDAIRSAIEAAEDNNHQAWKDLKKHNINKKDIVIGISASGTTPYVIGGLKECQKNKIYTGSISCNHNMEINNVSNLSIILNVGPEFLTGSTRMKSGTAQKMTLNMLTTSVMIKLGYVMDNKMIDMHIKNKKLKERGIKMICEICNTSKIKAEALLKKYGNIRLAIKNFKHD
ncbi:MAG: N-acetylmuramic acid 6-phosphate etherase [Flavobacteriales bacterium]|jgi:N-acetylmuramic acid 6-phosphate etherase|nr:N-acetylmuramic acid 6-phosphate etherase [Flavobacteriales bacterium]|tara:strand:- start:7960 stop:8766 length:807 start_codon:yes stop_codon:yes gene_type:complete